MKKEEMKKKKKEKEKSTSDVVKIDKRRRCWTSWQVGRFATGRALEGELVATTCDPRRVGVRGRLFFIYFYVKNRNRAREWLHNPVKLSNAHFKDQECPEDE